MNVTFETVVETDTYQVEVDSFGEYYVSMLGAATRVHVTPAMYKGWTEEAIEEMQGELLKDGMSNYHFIQFLLLAGIAFPEPYGIDSRPYSIDCGEVDPTVPFSFLDYDVLDDGKGGQILKRIV